MGNSPRLGLKTTPRGHVGENRATAERIAAATPPDKTPNRRKRSGKAAPGQQERKQTAARQSQKLKIKRQKNAITK